MQRATKICTNLTGIFGKHTFHKIDIFCQLFCKKEDVHCHACFLSAMEMFLTDDILLHILEFFNSINKDSRRTHSLY